MPPRKRKAATDTGGGGPPARKQRTETPPEQEAGSRAPMPAPIPAPEHEEIPTPTTTRQVTSRGRLVLSDLGFEADCDLVGQVEEGRFTLAHLLTIHLDSSAAGVDEVTQKETPALHAAMLPIRRGRGDDLDSATPDRSPPPSRAHCWNGCAGACDVGMAVPIRPICCVFI